MLSDRVCNSHGWMAQSCECSAKPLALSCNSVLTVFRAEPPHIPALLLELHVENTSIRRQTTLCSFFTVSVSGFPTGTQGNISACLFSAVHTQSNIQVFFSFTAINKFYYRKCLYIILYASVINNMFLMTKLQE